MRVLLLTSVKSGFYASVWENSLYENQSVWVSFVYGPSSVPTFHCSKLLSVLLDGDVGLCFTDGEVKKEKLHAYSMQTSVSGANCMAY